MAIKLNKAGYEKAETMIREGVEVEHISNNWEEVKPTVDDQLRYLEGHDLDEYGEWFLAIDTTMLAENRAKFSYPFGDFNVLQESALIVASEQAKKNHHDDIYSAAQALLKKIADSKK